MLCACGGDEAVQANTRMDAGGDDDSSADAGAVDDSGAEAPALSVERERSVRTADRQLAGLSASGQVLSLFVKQDPTLDLDQDACGNGDAVGARVEEASLSQDAAPCATVQVSCDGSQASVEASFDACSVGESGVVVSGDVTATVQKTEVDGAPLITVRLSFTDLTVTRDDGTYQLSGEVETRTSDLISYGLTVDLTSEDYRLTFEGVLAAQENAEGDLRALTLDGAGDVTGPSMEEDFDSWSCTGSALAYTIEGFHVSIDQCHADAGILELEEEYTCEATVSARGGTRTLSSTAEVQDVITWDSETPSTGLVHVVTSTTVAGQTTTKETDVALPDTCGSDD